MDAHNKKIQTKKILHLYHFTCNVFERKCEMQVQKLISKFENIILVFHVNMFVRALKKVVTHFTKIYVKFSQKRQNENVCTSNLISLLGIF